MLRKQEAQGVTRTSHSPVTVETHTGQQPITTAKRSDSDNKHMSQMSTSIDAQENPGSKSHNLDPDKMHGFAIKYNPTQSQTAVVQDGPPVQVASKVSQPKVDGLLPLVNQVRQHLVSNGQQGDVQMDGTVCYPWNRLSTDNHKRIHRCTGHARSHTTATPGHTSSKAFVPVHDPHMQLSTGIQDNAIPSGDILYPGQQAHGFTPEPHVPAVARKSRHLHPVQPRQRDRIIKQ